MVKGEWRLRLMLEAWRLRSMGGQLGDRLTCEGDCLTILGGRVGGGGTH